MEFTLEKDFQEEIGLTEDTAPKIIEKVNEFVADQKKNWDGKANNDAEAIIQGALDSTLNKFGIQGFERNNGEKLADALGRLSPMVVDSALAKEKQTLTGLKSEYEEKIKNGEFDKQLKADLDAANSKINDLLKIEAEYSDWKENDYKGKYEKVSNDLLGMRRSQAYKSIRPVTPDSVNKYEADYKWSEFERKIDQNFNLVEENGTFKAVDKDNPHKSYTLESLLTKEKELNEFFKGRQQGGLRSKDKSIKIEGIPFDIPENPSSKDINNAIKDYLRNELKLSNTSKEYSDKFKELNKQIREKNPV